jgi:transposase
MTTANAIRGLMPSVLQVKSREDLPDDVEKLKDMVLAALSSNDELAQQVAWLKRVLWGKKSERIASPEQEDLFQQARERLGLVPADPADEQHEFISPEDCPGAAESEPSAAKDDTPSEDGQGAAESGTDKANVDKPKPVMPKGPVKTKRGGAREKKRGSFLGGTVPANTPVVTTHVCLDGATCPVCAMPLTLLGADSRKRVEYVPGRFIIQETVVETGICLEHPHGSIFTPEVPEVIIPGGVLGNELAVNIIVDKFADGIPLHRQARRFERKGVHIPTSTLSRNVIAAAALAGGRRGPVPGDRRGGPERRADDARAQRLGEVLAVAVQVPGGGPPGHADVPALVRRRDVVDDPDVGEDSAHSWHVAVASCIPASQLHIGDPSAPTGPQQHCDGDWLRMHMRCCPTNLSSSPPIPG